MGKCSPEPEGWSFMADTDHAGNAKVQNRLSIPDWLINKLNGAPVMCESKASSVTSASPRIGEAHANASSAGGETYSVWNTPIMGLSYVVEEMGMIFH